MNFMGTGQPLLPADLRNALTRMDLDPTTDLPTLWSVLVVESRGFGFLPDRRPKILFERHIFFRETEGRFAAAAPDICAKTGGGYLGGAAEFDRLERALKLCRQAKLGDEPALRSASWGLGQVMGFNAASAGFSGAEELVAGMCESEGAQLAGMVGFIVDGGLDVDLRSRDWTVSGQPSHLELALAP
jgi:hypothetical protein